MRLAIASWEKGASWRGAILLEEVTSKLGKIIYMQFQLSIPAQPSGYLAPSVMFVELRRPPFGGGRTRLPSCETPYPLPCFCLLLDVQWFCG